MTQEVPMASRTRERLLHPATIIATGALFVALGGATYAATKVGPKQLRTAAVTAPKIRAGAVTTPKIRNSAVTSAKLAPGAVEDAIGVGSITTVKIQNGAISNEKLGDGAVSEAKLQPNAAVRGAGRLATRSAQVSSGPGSQELLSLPGRAGLRIGCSGGEGRVTLVNLAPGEVSSTLSTVAAGSPAEIGLTTPTLRPGAQQGVPNTGAGDVQTVEWRSSFTDSAGAHVTSAWVSLRPGPGGSCLAAAQILTGA
jgi:hypothetical protein